MDDQEKLQILRKMVLACLVVIVILSAMLVWNYVELRNSAEVQSGQYVLIDVCEAEIQQQCGEELTMWTELENIVLANNTTR